MASASVDWYIATRDGLHEMRDAVKCGAMHSDEIGDEPSGMALSKWQENRLLQDVRQALYATLASFVACEDGIRQVLKCHISSEYDKISREQLGLAEWKIY